MIDDKTPALNLPLPAAGNTLSEDVVRLRDALTAIDTAVDAKADEAHSHEIADVAGLAAALAAKVNASSLAAVALSGAYADLTGKPALFSGSYTDLTNKPAIPSKVSQLENDSGFITPAGLDGGTY